MTSRVIIEILSGRRVEDLLNRGLADNSRGGLDFEFASNVKQMY